MQNKSNLISIESNLTALDALEIMRHFGFKHLPVERDAKIIGVVCKKNLSAAVDSQAPHMAVETFTSSLVTYTKPTTLLADLIKDWLVKQVDYALVLDNYDKPISIITCSDLFSYFLSILEGLPARDRNLTVADCMRK